MLRSALAGHPAHVMALSPVDRALGGDPVGKTRARPDLPRGVGGRACGSGMMGIRPRPGANVNQPSGLRYPARLVSPSPQVTQDFGRHRVHTLELPAHADMMDAARVTTEARKPPGWPRAVSGRRFTWLPSHRSRRPGRRGAPRRHRERLLKRLRAGAEPCRFLQLSAEGASPGSQIRAEVTRHVPRSVAFSVELNARQACYQQVCRCPRQDSNLRHTV
jgi:hypothetical protein